MSRRLDKIGREIRALDEDLAVLGETVSLFVNSGSLLATLPRAPGCRTRKERRGSRDSCRCSAASGDKQRF